jgi:hypothetical protein
VGTWYPATSQQTNCLLVVLLDEADIFLGQRSMTDLKRNALVSGIAESPVD